MKCKRPFSSSSFVLKALQRMHIRTDMRALDIPCGFGRHSFLLESLGINVEGVDIDFRRIQNVSEQIANRPQLMEKRILFREGDANLIGVEYHNAFDLIIMTDFYSVDALERIHACLKNNGTLVFETFSGRGGNWIDLPYVGMLSKMLSKNLSIAEYHEKRAGPMEENRCSVKCIATKSSVA